MTLFREEVLAHKHESLHGAINLALPMSWRVISFALMAIILVAGMFLGSASYSRSETATGSVVPTNGILKVLPQRAGRVEAVNVREGQFVRRGTTLARIRVEETDRSGAGTQTGILSAIDVQQRGLAEQRGLTRSAAIAEQSEFKAQLKGLRQEIQNIDTQISVQDRLVEMAQNDLARVSEIAKRGFVSERDLATREETLLSRRQQLAALQQNLTAKTSSLNQAARAQAQAAAVASGTSAALAASEAQVERERLSTRGDQGYSLVAPADGQVAALDIHVGDAVGMQQLVMMIVPRGGELIARLLVPGKAAAFIKAGQSVRLALDAYPYDRFGTVHGVITSLSSAPVPRDDEKGGSAPFYVASAAIPDPAVRAYGRKERLLPGMTFSARIITEKRSLLEWIFDPLFAAARP